MEETKYQTKVNELESRLDSVLSDLIACNEELFNAPINKPLQSDYLAVTEAIEKACAILNHAEMAMKIQALFKDSCGVYDGKNLEACKRATLEAIFQA